MDQRQQNSTAHSVLFFMADSSDHVSGKTGLTPVVTLSKNGGAFAAAAGTVSEVGQGWYALAGNATDRGTLGELIIHGEASGADPSDRRLTIVPWDPFDANLGLPRLDVAVSSRASANDYTSARATKLDNLDATVSSRSTLTAANVWANATRTITGTGTGAITATSFAASAIDSAALAASAVTEIQTGLATAADQSAILGYVDELESRLTTTRAANLDNLDAAVSSRSTLTAANVWANATRTITGTTAGAIVAASFAADAIDAAALATTAITEIQSGLATAANQSTILGYVDQLESRLTDTRATYLDNLVRLDVAVSSRSMLSASDVWSYAARTITGLSSGAIVAASFAANAIDAAALDATAVTEIQSGLATAANQSTIIGYVDQLESRLTSARATNLDNLDAAVSSRSTLTAANVWANASRTITGMAAGTIVAGSFAADAIDAAALATSAVTEIQAGLATAADQSTLLAYVDELESRLTATRAANLDRLDATVSSRSTLTATDVWSQPARTITGLSAGAITAASFAASAIDATAIATSAVTEIQTGLATAANQSTILGYVDDLESRLTATRAANLDNLDAAISTRSTLTAANVWSSATRTITGVGTGAIVAGSFAANAIDAAALADSAVAEIQSGIATTATQTAIISYIDDLESRLTAERAAGLDNLDATVSSRLAASSYVVPDNVSIDAIEAVLAGITNLAHWLRAIVRSDEADAIALAEINDGGGTYDEAQHSLIRTASLAELLEADRFIDTSVTPWALVLMRKNTGGPGVGVELLRQQLFTETGAHVNSIESFIGRSIA